MTPVKLPVAAGRGSHALAAAADPGVIRVDERATLLFDDRVRSVHVA
jgi:hypothetical protein